MGLQFPGGKWRAADIALYQRKQLHGVPLQNHYLDIPPQVVIEVDTQADLTQFNTPLDYYYTKTDALLDFGVEKVIWIFTDARKVMVAEKAQDWVTRNWESEVGDPSQSDSESRSTDRATDIVKHQAKLSVALPDALAKRNYNCVFSEQVASSANPGSP